MTEASTSIESQVAVGYEFHSDLVGEGIADLIAAAPVYQKQGRIKARIVTEQETIETYINGRLETTKVANPGDAVVENPGGEKYALEARSFNKRYDEDTNNPGWYIAKGKVRVIPNPFGKPIAIIPSWGGLMYGDESCYLASTVDLTSEEVETPGNIYIIDNEAFEETYRLKV